MISRRRKGLKAKSRARKASTATKRGVKVNRKRGRR